VWIVLAGDGNVWLSIIPGVLGGTLAMIGPGAWSIDARLFGRKQIGS
jgi:putative oxidoreductase